MTPPPPSGVPDPDATWWSESDEAEEDEDLEGDDEAEGLQTVAGPGWREDLKADLLESLSDIAAIEDPEDAFAPAEPPDLFTFYGELAALRHELRAQGQRANDGLAQLGKSLAPLLRPPSAEKGSKAAPPSSSWPLEHCLALLSVWDLLLQTAAAAACEASLAPLLRAAGLARVPAVGRPFDAAP